MLIRTDYATYFAEHTPRNVCFAEQDAADAPGAGEELDLAEDAPAEGESDDDLDELEIGPTKYKVPKAVKEGWNGLQKTTQSEREAVKIEKAAIEKERTSYAETEKARIALMDEIADIKGADKELAKYKEMTPAKWVELSRSNPEQYQEHWAYYQGLMVQRDAALRSAQAKAVDLDAQGRKAQSERMAAMDKDISTKIKDWTPEKKATITKFAIDAGLSADEAALVTSNSVAIELLQDAMAARAARARAAAARAAAAKQAKDEIPAPEPTGRVRTTGKPPGSLADSVDSATWLKNREADVRRKGLR